MLNHSNNILISGIIVVCLIAICVLLSPFILLYCICCSDKTYDGGGGNDNGRGNDIDREWLYSCIEFLKMFPSSNNVITSGVPLGLVSIVSMIMPNHTFIMIHAKQTKIKLPYNIDDIKTMTLEDAINANNDKPRLLFYMGNDIGDVYSKIKPIACTYKVTQTGEQFIKYDKKHEPDWDDAVWTITNELYTRKKQIDNRERGVMSRHITDSISTLKI